MGFRRCYIQHWFICWIAVHLVGGTPIVLHTSKCNLTGILGACALEILLSTQQQLNNCYCVMPAI